MKRILFPLFLILFLAGCKSAPFEHPEYAPVPSAFKPETTPEKFMFQSRMTLDFGWHEMASRSAPQPLPSASAASAEHGDLMRGIRTFSLLSDGGNPPARIFRWNKPFAELDSDAGSSPPGSARTPSRSGASAWTARKEPSPSAHGRCAFRRRRTVCSSLPAASAHPRRRPPVRHVARKLR